MSQRYIRALTAVGALPWMIPLVGDEPETLRGIYDELDGVFLPGGADIDPGRWPTASPCSVSVAVYRS